MPKPGKIFLFLVFSLAIALMFFSDPLVSSSGDPFHLGMGARPLGMGRVFTSIADDTNALFLNPAGLGRYQDDRLLSMYSTILEDLTYILLAGTKPSPWGGIGFGLLSISAGDFYTTHRDQYGRIVPDEAFDYNNQVLFAGWGRNLNEKVSIGINAKLYNEGSGKGVGGSASGLGFDFGTLINFHPQWQAGLFLRNIVTTPKAWKTGRIEHFNQLGRLGIAYLPNNLVTAALDLEFEQNRPVLFNLGTELRPIRPFAFRLGLDQEAIGPSTALTNFSLGMGLRIGTFEFDYAYRIYSQQEFNNTHYVSISLGKLRPEKNIDIPSFIAQATVKYKNEFIGVGLVGEPQVLSVKKMEKKPIPKKKIKKIKKLPIKKIVKVKTPATTEASDNFYIPEEVVKKFEVFPAKAKKDNFWKIILAIIVAIATLIAAYKINSKRRSK